MTAFDIPAIFDTLNQHGGRRIGRGGRLTDPTRYDPCMGTTFSLRDLGISPGQGRHEELELELVPYVQGAIEYADDHGGGKAPKSSVPAPDRIEYVVDGGQVPAQLDVTAMTEGTSFRLRFHADYAGPCSRCLEPATWSVDVDAHAVHDPEADDDELKSEHVDDKLHQLHVSGWAREEVGLLFPTQVLCRSDCRGLCGECGINLNEHPDHAHEQPMDSRWDALRDLQLEGDADAT